MRETEWMECAHMCVCTHMHVHVCTCVCVCVLLGTQALCITQSIILASHILHQAWGEPSARWGRSVRWIIAGPH